jgi:hypothetical protein
MKKILDYKLVSAASAGEVENFVRTYLQDGWELHGAPSCAPQVFCQALIKHAASRAASASAEIPSSLKPEP